MSLETYSVAEIMRIMGVSQHCVLHWLNSGQLNGFPVNKDEGQTRTRWRVTRDELERFIKSRQINPDPPLKRRRKRGSSDVKNFV